MSYSHDQRSKLMCINAHYVTLLLCGFSENALEIEEFLAWLWLRSLPPLEPEPNYP